MTDAPAVAPTPSPARLVTGPFVSLAVAALAFYVAGGILLPVTPRFVEDLLRLQECLGRPVPWQWFAPGSTSQAGSGPDPS